MCDADGRQGCRQDLLGWNMGTIPASLRTLILWRRQPIVVCARRECCERVDDQEGEVLGECIINSTSLGAVMIEAVIGHRLRQTDASLECGGMRSARRGMAVDPLATAREWRAGLRARRNAQRSAAHG